jgi:membrane dipeptidase
MRIRPVASEARSYPYLKAGRDYPVFEFPPEIGRVQSRTVAVADAEEQRVQDLLGRVMVISVHDHPTRRPLDLSTARAYRKAGRDVTGYAGLSVSGLDVVFDGLMAGANPITSASGWKWTDTIHDLGMRLCDFAHQGLVMAAYSLRDLETAKREGRIAVVLTLEAATSIENELDRLDILFGLGVRSMGLVYSESNQVGSGLSEARDGGLTHFGQRVVRRMNQLGLLIDVSHASDLTALDAVEASDAPVVITHAGARQVWPSTRMKPDEVIRACAGSGGLIGIEAAPHTTMSPKHPAHDVEAVMHHFEYCVELVGIDHVTFGPDTHFGDHVGWHHEFAAELSTDHEQTKASYEEVAFVDGLENPSETFPNIVRWLVSHGYSDEDIEKAIGGNTLRVLREVWPGS